MAHRPLVVLVSVRVSTSVRRVYPPFGRFKGTNDRSAEEIPPNRVPHHLMEWYSARRHPRERDTDRDDARTGGRLGRSGEGQLAGARSRRSQLPADIVTPAQHLV